MANSPYCNTRVLLLSDTHGQVHPKILALAAEVDAIVHAGDIGHPAVLDKLSAAGRPLLAVRGNNDVPAKWPADAHGLLEELPLATGLDLPGGRLMVEHGDRANPVARRHAMLRDRHAGARLVLYGHSHRQLIDDTAEPWVVNPGAAGRSRTYGGAGCVLLRATATKWSLEALRFGP
jgi:putative phosphoesterase